MKKTFAFFLLLFVVLPACTVQKRTVNKGYFVQWHFGQKAGKQVIETDKTHTLSPNEMLSEEQILSPEIAKQTEISEVPSDSVIEPQILSEKEFYKVSFREKNGFNPGNVEKTAHRIKPDDKKKEDTMQSREMYLARAIGNLALILLALFAGYILVILMIFLGDPVIFILVISCVHIIAASFFKALAFFKMARIIGKAEKEERPAAEDIQKQKKKIKTGRLIINAIFLALYLIFFGYLLALQN